jgi:tetratricopeptide (TPR) repeat protein
MNIIIKMKNVISVAILGCVFCMRASSVFADPAIDAFNANRLDEAKKLFTQQLDKPDTKNNALYYLAATQEGLGDFDKALELTNQALATEPNSADEYFLLGSIYCDKAQAASIFSALGFAKQCVNSFEAAHKVDNYRWNFRSIICTRFNGGARRCYCNS